MRERSNTSEGWRLVPSADIRSANMLFDTLPAQISFDDLASEFTFYGPYLDEAASQDPEGSEIYKISIAPDPQDTRMVELCHSAKFVEVEDQTSFLMIPSDGHDALIDLAVAECVRGNDDSLEEKYLESGGQKLSMFLTRVRDRQLQDTRTVEPYVDDLDLWRVFNNLDECRFVLTKVA